MWNDYDLASWERGITFPVRAGEMQVKMTTAGALDRRAHFFKELSDTPHASLLITLSAHLIDAFARLSPDEALSIPIALSKMAVPLEERFKNL